MTLPKFQPTLGAYVNALFHRFDTPTHNDSNLGVLPTRGSPNRRRESPRPSADSVRSVPSLPAYQMFSTGASFWAAFPLFTQWLLQHSSSLSVTVKDSPALPRDAISPSLPSGYMAISRQTIKRHDGTSWVDYVVFTPSEQDGSPIPVGKSFYWKWT